MPIISKQVSKNIKRVLIFATLVALSSYFAFNYIANAQSSADQGDSSSVDDLQKKIKDYEKKLNDLKGTEASLAKEIEYADGQISLTELRIQNSLAKIKQKTIQIQKLSGDINDIIKRINSLILSISYQEKVLDERFRARYKSIETSPIMVIFGSSTINSLIQKSEYLRVMEIQDRRLLTQMNDAKESYNQQKTILVQTKAREEQLKVSIEQEKRNLEGYQSNLIQQKSDKQLLLDVTQNDETKYQKLLDDAKKELNQILGAVAVLQGKNGTPVKKGDIIGIQGSTGRSTGDHLHFGVYKYSSFTEITGWNWYYSNYVDPASKLKKKNVYWNTGCDSASNRNTGGGDWTWPLSDPTISQGFGHTCWSSIYYGGNPHPAFDMYGSYGAPVYAVEDGEAYFCKNCLGDGANGVFIFHDKGYMTIYWHLR